MRRTNPGAGQHRNRQFGRHTHIDRHPVALLNATRLQHIGELLHLAVKLLISKSPDLPRFAFPHDRGLVLARSLDMPIQAVIGNIGLATNKPLGPGSIPLQNPVPRLKPVQFARDFAPKLLRVLYRFAVKAFVSLQAANVGARAKLRRRLKFTLFLKNRFNAAGLVAARFVGSARFVRCR